MNTIINQTILSQENTEFFNEYIELLVNRLTHANMSLESDLGDADNYQNALRLKDNMIAFKMLVEGSLNGNTLTEELIISTADIVNKDSMYISNGYRSGGGYYLVDTNIPISNALDVSKDMFYLIKKYHEDCKDYEPFEREARFHIEFIRIHPFEDGNGRTSRLILNYNLLSQSIAPVIITVDLEEYYHSYIKNYDIKGMANLFKIQSTRENEVIHQLFDRYNREQEKDLYF